MIETLRIALRIFIPAGQRMKWLGLIGLSLAVAGAEMVTAFLIFRVLSFATAPPADADAVSLVLGIEVKLVPLLVIAGTAFVLRGLLAILYTYAQSRIVQSAGAAVSALVHRRYLQAPYRFHLTRSSSESVRTVLWSVDAATLNALNPLVTIVSQGLIMATLVGLLVAIAPGLSLAAIATLGVALGVILLFVQPRLGRLGRLSEDTVKGLLASVRDSFDSVRDIKAYRAEAYFDVQFRRHRNVLAQLRTGKSVLEEVPSSGLEFVVVIGLLLLVGLAQGDAVDDYVPVLGAFVYATLRIMPSLTKVVAAVNRIKFGRQAVENVDNDLRSAVPTESSNETAIEASPGELFERAVRLADISFTYQDGAQKALDGVDLEIHRGEMLAVVGESGSGKSTLVDVLLGLLEPDAGRILLDGSDSLPAGWYRHIGVVSQHVILLDASLRDNVAFGAGRRADDAHVRSALETAQLTDWLETLPGGLDAMVGESGKLLSGDERQRVAIARSLYRDPDLLILDEATSALDGATEAALLEHLRSLSSSMTTVVVSHRAAPIRAADRVALMDAGRIVAVGTYNELLARETRFRDLVGLPGEDGAA
jgi:ABC-type multidrug transport system fused ATPase/permease subunit